MNILLLGHGKTGSLVAEIARERGHQVTVITSTQNQRGTALSADRIRGTDAVIDFTTPGAVIGNIEACARAGVNMVVGTTGWYEHLPRVREMVEKAGIGFVYASNFSIGVNMFFEITRLAGAAARHGYSARILERHHVHKKDAPSGTAVTIQKTLQPEAADPHAFKHVAIESIREGDIVGEHTVILESDADIITLQHAAKSRRGFAEGAVVAAEWIAGKRAFYDFSSVWRDLA